MLGTIWKALAGIAGVVLSALQIFRFFRDRKESGKDIELGELRERERERGRQDERLQKAKEIENAVEALPAADLIERLTKWVRR